MFQEMCHDVIIKPTLEGKRSRQMERVDKIAEDSGHVDSIRIFEAQGMSSVILTWLINIRINEMSMKKYNIDHGTSTPLI